MVANLTQILNFKATFHQEFKLFSKNKIYANNGSMLDTLRFSLVFFYKIINGLPSIETEGILTPADSHTRKNHSFKFKHLQANCASYLFSFFPATVSSWNKLPASIWH